MIDPKTSIPRHIIVKLLKTKDKVRGRAGVRHRTIPDPTAFFCYCSFVLLHPQAHKKMDLIFLGLQPLSWWFYFRIENTSSPKTTSKPSLVFQQAKFDYAPISEPILVPRECLLLIGCRLDFLDQSLWQRGRISRLYETQVPFWSSGKINSSQFSRNHSVLSIKYQSSLVLVLMSETKLTKSV